MPRFQFSLRTLLIVVTLLAMGFGYVTWQARKTIAERKAMLVQIRAIGGFVRVAGEGNAGRSVATVPFIRKLFGDEAVEMIFISIDALHDGPAGLSLREVQEVFPEAKVLEARKES